MDNNIWDNIGRAVTGAADTVGRKATEVAGVAKLKNQNFRLEQGHEAVTRPSEKSYTSASRLRAVSTTRRFNSFARKSRARKS